MIKNVKIYIIASVGYHSLLLFSRFYIVDYKELKMFNYSTESHIVRREKYENRRSQDNYLENVWK